MKTLCEWDLDVTSCLPIQFRGKEHMFWIGAHGDKVVTVGIRDYRTGICYFVGSQIRNGVYTDVQYGSTRILVVDNSGEGERGLKDSNPYPMFENDRVNMLRLMRKTMSFNTQKLSDEMQKLWRQAQELVRKVDLSITPDPLPS